MIISRVHRVEESHMKSPGRRAVLGATLAAGLTAVASAPARAGSPRPPAEPASDPHLDAASLSGEQYGISYGNQSAVVTELGAGLRSFRMDDTELLDTYGPSAYPTGSSYGQLLVPWPNRIDHGTYEFDGAEQELPWSEPANQNAIHGLTRWMNWQPVERSRSRLVMGLVLHAQPGYPFVLRLRQAYELGRQGLTVTTAAENIGPARAPYGSGQHPYFTLGTPSIDDVVLTLPAAKYFRTDARSIPQPPPVTVAGTPYDFRRARRIGATQMDTGFANLVRDRDGRAWVRMSSPRSPLSLKVWLDREHEFLQVYTGDTLPEAARRRGLAIEPYTCASNAFNNGYGLRVLDRGERFEASWGVQTSRN
ncbi:aldose epimerase [Streptomyces sp. H27-H1]|uniref:aldose 1-epimerase family protein n=1 Tax=Streptomyces sp. H27-H1 TaxID=2996461 RepID=UPI00226DE168|nr:aldose epimerase [Streptomyces sp. H27-H1]MCY0932143.1 aldose epimerase [Streptomyces sp. H27-H1]